LPIAVSLSLSATLITTALAKAILEPPCSQEPQQHTASVPLALTIVTCYNCYKLGYIALACPKPKRANLKEICEDKEEVFEESEKEEP